MTARWWWPGTAMPGRSTSCCTDANTRGVSVCGYSEQGTTTTPFDMVVLNQMSRYHLAAEALRRVRGHFGGTEELAVHHDYVREHLDDMPEIRDWIWSPPSD